MTKRHCPTCHQVVPDVPPLPVRVRAALAAAAPLPLRPKSLREATGAGEAVMYQTLRRMQERGEIRKSTVADGNGYILVPEQGGTHPLDEDPTPDPAVSAVNDLRIYVESVGGIVKDRAVAFLERLGVEHRQAEVMLASALEAEVFTEENGRIFA